MGTNIRPQVVAELDRDWAEAREWFLGQAWGTESLERFTTLLSCPPGDLRADATEGELECLQRLAGIAFYETWRRAFDAVADELTDQNPVS